MKRIKKNINLIGGVIVLGFRIARLWVKKNWKMILLCVAMITAIMLLIFLGDHDEGKPAYYIDWDNYQGVAKRCWSEDGGLLCEKEYGGVISVKQYWNIED